MPTIEIKKPPYLNICDIALSATITTLAIGVIRLPVDKYFLMASNTNTEFDARKLFRTAALYTGLRSYIAYNMPRSCYLVSSKNAVKPNNEETQLSNRIKTIGGFAAIETFFSHVPEQVTALAQQKIDYKNNIHNIFAYTRAGLFLRFASSAVNLHCLTYLQEDYLQNLFQVNQGVKPSFMVNLGSASLCAITATFWSYPLKQLQTQINAHVKLEAERLVYPKIDYLIKNNFQTMRSSPLSHTLKTTSAHFFLRAIQSVFVFGTVITTSAELGPTPAQDLYENIRCFSIRHQK